MNTDTCEPLRLIHSGLDKLGHSPGAIDGLWGLRTARAMKALLAANGRAASLAPPGPLPWIPVSTILASSKSASLSFGGIPTNKHGVQRKKVPLSRWPPLAGPLMMLSTSSNFTIPN